MSTPEAVILPVRSPAAPGVGPWAGVFYRATGVRYANSRDLLAGEGSSQIGGRWNPPGIRAIYGSLHHLTAMHESLANYEDHGIPPSQAMPLVFVGINARLQAILDIAEMQFLKPLGLAIADLVRVDWRAEQDAGNASLDPGDRPTGIRRQIGGFAGAVGPRSRLRNIVVFPQRRRKGSSIRIENVRQLPKKKEG